MTKFTFCLIAIVLGAVFKVSLAGSIALQSNQVNLLKDKCSAFSGLLPDPKSGCCGRHTEQGNDKEDAVENNIYNENSLDDADSELGGGITNDAENKKRNRDGVKCIDIGGVINNVVNNVLDNIKDRVTTWISKFSVRKAEEIMSLNDEENTFNTKTDDYNPNLPGMSSTGGIGFIPEGNQAGLRQYPWLVRFTIANGDDTVSTCGGSLISPRFVLTAADCLNKAYKSLDDINIYFAEYNINTISDCVGGTCIETVMMHPDMIIVHEDFSYKLDGLFNDIALMRLRESTPYTDYIRPICLPPFNIDVSKNEGTPLEIAGWGNTKHGASSIKQAAQVQLVTQSQCKKYYSMLNPGQICAVGRTGQDTCRGVSGGPLMMEKDGSFYLVGIISGKETFSSCGSSKPGFYTNVFAYTKWIQDNVNI